MSKLALIIIDLMARIVALEATPHSGAVVVERAAQLASELRRGGAVVALVRTERPGVACVTAGSDFVPELTPVSTDVVVVKHTWNAFHGTSLNVILRSRGVRTVVLAGIATNFGVESTARAADELGYELVFAEDAISGLDAYAHAFAVDYVFPRLGRVCSVNEIIARVAA